MLSGARFHEGSSSNSFSLLPGHSVTVLRQWSAVVAPGTNPVSFVKVFPGHAGFFARRILRPDYWGRRQASCDAFEFGQSSIPRSTGLHCSGNRLGAVHLTGSGMP